MDRQTDTRPRQIGYYANIASYGESYKIDYGMLTTCDESGL